MHFKLIHADKACHKCKSCKKSFIRITDLKKHIISVHVKDSDLTSEISLETPIINTEICNEIEIECYFCDLCTEEFKTEAEWKKHKLEDNHRLKLVTVALDKSITI